MSVIQNLRTKYAKVVGGIIGLSLVGFILMDAAGGPLKTLFGNDDSIARVNGSKVDGKEYQSRMADYELLVPIFSKGKPLDEATRAQIRQQVLDELVYENLIADDAEKLGITVTEAELKDLIRGTNPDPMVQQFPYFADPNTGQFNPQSIAEFERQVPQIPDVNTREKLLAEWDALKRMVGRNRKLQKYNALVSGAIYTPEAIVKRSINDGAELVSVRFVKLPYVMVPDADVKVTDADLNNYLQSHKQQYTIDQPTRSIDYVSYDILPSAQDTQRSLGALQQFREEFVTTNDNENFVGRHSEIPFMDRYFTAKSLGWKNADSLLSQPVGAVVGPFYENGAYQMVKILDKKQMPDSVKAQHILLAANQQRDDSAAHRMADSLVAAIKNGVPFDTLAVRYSDDASNKNKGGDLGYFSAGMMVPEFDQAAFGGQKGEIKTVKTQFGWHILRINDQKDMKPAAKIAVVAKALEPSAQTNEAAYNKAIGFAGNNGNGKAFDAAVAKEGLQKKIAENIRMNDFTINGLGASRELIRWVWEKGRKTGDVSSPFEIDNRYVVAKVSSDQQAGLMALDATSRPQIEQLVKAQKKAEVLIKQYGKMKTLDEVANASKQPIMTADSFSAANPFAPNIGFEPKVVGYAFYKGLKEGQTSPAIKGNDGVFFLSPVRRMTGTVPPMADLMKQQQNALTAQLRQVIVGALQQSLRQKAKVTYNTKML